MDVFAIRIRKQADRLPGTTVRIAPPVIPNPHSFTRATLLIDDATTGLGLGSSDGSGCGYTGEIDYFPANVFPGNFLNASGGYAPAANSPVSTTSSAPASAATARISRFPTSPRRWDCTP